MLEHSFGFYCIVFFGIILLRYFFIAGGLYLSFYSPWNQSFPDDNSLHRSSADWGSMRRDIQLSVLSTGVFALAAAFIMTSYSWGMTRLYNDSQQYGLWYLGISYSVVLMLQDSYFYFTHRLFHNSRLFPWFHQGHHRSRHPTPWTSFAFDPLEAIVQSFFLVGITFIIPLHLVTLFAVLITMTVWAVINHLGIERLPTFFPHHWLGRWVIGPAHHSIHHRKYTLHYGLYFTFWDNFLGTQDPAYKRKILDHHP